MRPSGRRRSEAGFTVIEALDADKLKFDGAVRTFTDKLSGADVALFFFAGHGSTRRLPSGREVGYIVPVDGGLNDLQARADMLIALTELALKGGTKGVRLQ